MAPGSADVVETADSRMKTKLGAIKSFLSSQTTPVLTGKKRGKFWDHSYSVMITSLFKFDSSLYTSTSPPHTHTHPPVIMLQPTYYLYDNVGLLEHMRMRKNSAMEIWNLEMNRQAICTAGIIILGALHPLWWCGMSGSLLTSLWLLSLMRLLASREYNCAPGFAVYGGQCRERSKLTDWCMDETSGSKTPSCYRLLAIFLKTHCQNYTACSDHYFCSTTEALEHNWHHFVCWGYSVLQLLYHSHHHGWSYCVACQISRTGHHQLHIPHHWHQLEIVPGKSAWGSFNCALQSWSGDFAGVPANTWIAKERPTDWNSNRLQSHRLRARKGKHVGHCDLSW